jgi:hypothetical protein
MTALRLSQTLPLPAGTRSVAGIIVAAGLAVAAFSSGLSAISQLASASTLQPVTIAGSLTPERPADYVTAGARVAPLRQLAS